MSKTFLIAWHEFGITVKRTGFIILTLAFPLLALFGIGIYHLISSNIHPSVTVSNVGYVDQAGGFDAFTDQANIKLTGYGSSDDARQALLDKEITAYFIIPRDFVSSGLIDLYTTKNELILPADTTAAISKFLSSNLLADKVSADIITRIEAPLNVKVTTLSSTGAVLPQQAGYAGFVVPGIFSFLLALSLIFTSTYALQSLGEEKENRVMEILLSSVSTRQLLTGKILGLGTAGLVQVIVWVITLPLLLTLASSSLGGIISTIHIPASFWVLGVLYFILGYLLFAVISSGIAAVSSTVREAQGIAGFYTMFSVAPFWFVSLLLLIPGSPVWVVLSIFPLTAPVIVMMRLGLLGVPIWQLAASTLVLFLCIVGGLLLDAKLLRVYLLLYGKRPGLVEIIRGLKRA